MSDEVKSVTVDSADVRKSLDRVDAVGDGSDVAGTEGFIPALRRNASVAVDSGSGIVDITGVRPPMLNIAYGVGKFADGPFSPGEMILGDNDLVAGKDASITVIVLKYSQFAKETISQEMWNSGIRPRVFPTLEAAKAAGLRTEWGPNSEKPDASFALDMMLLIKKPEKTESGMFGITLGGEAYALAMASYDKTAYRSVSDTFLRSVVFSMRNKKTWSGGWELKTQIRVAKKTGNKSWVPLFSLKRFLTDAEVAEIEAQFGSFLVAPIEPVAVPDPLGN